MVKAGWAMTVLFTLFMLGASVAPKLLGMDAATAWLSAVPARRKTANTRLKNDE